MAATSLVIPPCHISRPGGSDRGARHARKAIRVVPVLNAEDGLARTARRPDGGRRGGSDPRADPVSDGGSTDATAQIAEEAGAHLVRRARHRAGGQLGAAPRLAGGEWLLFLHADSALPHGWTRAALAQMADRAGPAISASPLMRAGWRRVSWPAGPTCARASFSLPYGDQGLLISRSEYDADRRLSAIFR